MILAAGLCASVIGRTNLVAPSLGSDEEKIKAQIKERGATAPLEKFVSTRINHFDAENFNNFGPTQAVWDMRYLINWQYYNKDQGPILFYTGNEGNVFSFYNNSGFIVDTLAKRFGAVVVFAEHRYYGKSMPFKTAEKSFTRENVKYLTVPQVMRDYVNLI